MSEAVREMLRHGFNDLGMNTIWCRYYEGNERSKRVQEKAGFAYHHTCFNVPVTQLNTNRTSIVNVMTKEQWNNIYK